MSGPRCPICQEAVDKDPYSLYTSTGVLITGVEAMMDKDFATLQALMQTFTPLDAHVAVMQIASLLIQAQIMTGISVRAMIQHWRENNEELLSQ